MVECHSLLLSLAWCNFRVYWSNPEARLIAELGVYLSYLIKPKSFENIFYRLDYPDLYGPSWQDSRSYKPGKGVNKAGFRPIGSQLQVLVNGAESQSLDRGQLRNRTIEACLV